MKKKRFVVTGLFICLTLLLLGLWNASVLRSKAAKNNDSAILQNIKEKQDQISKAEKEKSGLKKNLSDVQSIQKNLESKKKEVFECPEKILVRQVGKYPICAYDNEQFYTLNTIYNIIVQVMLQVYSIVMQNF